MLELYHNNMSVCAQKVRVVLAEKGVDYVGHVMDIRAGETHTPEYTALNPKGVVPTLLADGAPIIESTIICEYLDEVYDAGSLSPRDPAGRAAMRQWTIRPDAGMHQAFGLLSFAVAFRHQNSSKQMTTRRAEEATVLLKSVIAHGVDSPELLLRIGVVRDVLKDIAKRLAGQEWLAGEAYSLADIAMLPYVCRLRDLGQEWLWAADSPYATIDLWLKRCYARPGYAGIADYLDTKYLSMMAESGKAVEPRLRELLAA